MQYWLIGIVILLCLYLAAVAFANADPRRLALLLKILGVAAAGAFALVLMLTGNAGVLFWLAPLIYAGYVRWRGGGGWRTASGPSPGQTSSVDTAALSMWLDHDSGTMGGKVLRGHFAGRALDGLDLQDLLVLRDELTAEDDGQSVQLLDAYLDRHHPDWRTDPGGATTDPPEGGGGSSGMTVNEAYGVLGLLPGAGEAEIREAHRRLMLRNHPDQGGSTYLAARINQAKDILLRGKRP